MAIIKAGTYRFNDVITPCDAMVSVSFPLSFTFKQIEPNEESVARAYEYLTPYIEQIANGELSEEEIESIMVEFRRLATENSTEYDAIGYGLSMDGSYSLSYGYIKDGEQNGIYVYDGHEDGSPGEWKLFEHGENIQTITVTEDIEAIDEFYTWFKANAVEQKQISGKWKWKDELTWPSFDAGYHDFPIDFSIVQSFTESQVQELVDLLVANGVANSIVVQPYTLTTNYSGFELFVSGTESSSEEVTYWILDYKDAVVTSKPYDAEVINFAGDALFDVNEAYSSFNGWHDYGDWRGLLQTIDFGTEPQYVSIDFYNWLTENATQPTATITYNGSTIFNLFNGQKAILECAGKKMESDVVVEVAEQSGGSSCSGNHVIEVDELPTENIDENSVYSCGGKYYKWANEFTDLIANMDGVLSMKELLSLEGAIVSFNIIPTKTTDGILESDGSSVLHFYYIEDEDNVFVYIGEWAQLSDMGLNYIGVISDVSEVTEPGLYALMVEGFKTLTPASGSLTITENGTYDVTDKASVDIALSAIVGIYEFSDYLVCDYRSFYGGKQIDVNFTTIRNGEVINCIGIRTDNGGDSEMQYISADGEKFYAVSQQIWFDEGYRIVDFGTEPQLIPSPVKEWLTEYAKPRENEIIEEYDGTITIT